MLQPCAHTDPTTWQESPRRSCTWVPMCSPIPQSHQLGTESWQCLTGGCWVWPGQHRDTGTPWQCQTNCCCCCFLYKDSLHIKKSSSLFLFELTSPSFKKQSKKPKNLFVFSWLIFCTPDNQLPLEHYWVCKVRFW